MARLRRVDSARIKSLRVSTNQLHVFVEGREVDSFVYDGICQAVQKDVPFTYDITRADEFPNVMAGGKEVLLNFYSELKTAGALSLTSKYTTVFFLDKDVDDLTRKKKRSPHLVYTPTYDIEGLVYRNGDLQRAVAAALSLVSSATNFLGGALDWCKSADTLWAEWIALILCALKLGTGFPGYGVPSKVNPNPHLPADALQIETHLSNIQMRTGVSRAVVDATYQRKLRKVRKMISSNASGELFKGKWYPRILVAQVADRLPASGASPSCVQAVQAVLLNQLDYEQAWALPFRTALKTLVTA